MVVKQALPRLRVADEWWAPRERALAEADALDLVSRITPGNVPQVLDRDPDRCALVVERAPCEWEDWKSLLLAGTIDPNVGARLGSMLARWHNVRSATDRPVLPDRSSTPTSYVTLGAPLRR
jgi:5-methylthioribose kinase